MHACPSYAAKKEKKREWKKRQQISSAEDESQSREPMHDEDTKGFEEEEQVSSGPDEHVRKSLYQQQRNKVLVLSETQVNAGIQSKPRPAKRRVSCHQFQCFHRYENLSLPNISLYIFIFSRNTWRVHLERMGQMTGNPHKMTQMTIQKNQRKKLNEGFPTCVRKRV